MYDVISRHKESSMKRSKLFIILLALALILTACGGSSEKDVEIVEQVMATEKPADTEVPPTPEPTATEEPEMLPVSMVSAVLGEGDFNTYKVSLPGMAPLDFEDSDWHFSGNVVIDTENGHIECDTADLHFSNHQLQIATIEGAPATFEMQRPESEEITYAHAGRVKYNFELGIVEALYTQ